MKLSKFDIEELEKTAKVLNDRDNLLRSTYRVVQTGYMNGEVLRVLGYVVASNKTGIVCLDFFLTEVEAWWSVSRYNQ